MEKHFLEQFKIHEKPEAIRAAEKEELRTGTDGIVEDRKERIEAYIKRLEHIFLNPDKDTKERNIELLKPQIYENTVIKKEDFPESHFEYQKKYLKSRGMGDISFDDEQKKNEIERIQEAQRKSLDEWISYLTGDDCRYPADIKYFAMQGVLKIGDFDDKREKYAFNKRHKDTTGPFAEIDREALSVVLGAVNAVHHNGKIDDYPKELILGIKNGKNFGDLYALTMFELDKKAGKKELLPITEGEWRVFPKDSDSSILTSSLEGKRSNLCIRDIGSAESYLAQGSIEIYFSNDKEGKPTVPRIAIAHADDKGGVYEVRGTYNKNEDVDPYIEATDILSKKLTELPNGEKFSKKDSDMKKMTEIERKTTRGITLTRDELVFLYELESPIEGFGYNKDPRIDEIRRQRDPLSDAPTILNCTREQIVQGTEEITEKTKVYIGKWNIDTYNAIKNYSNIQHFYESFPDKPIFMKTIETDPNIQTPEEARQAILAKGCKIYTYADQILEKTPFSKEKKSYDLVSFTVEQLGFPQGAKLRDIYAKAKELGLELCPAEVGPLLRLQYTNQPDNNYLRIAMEPISDADGNPTLFLVLRGDGEFWLDDSRGYSGHEWISDYQFVFLRRK
jgi:hypothetical protein